VGGEERPLYFGTGCQYCDGMHAIADTATTADPDAAVPEAADASEAALLEEDLLIEDVSIDGMCGVY
jgi:mycofactocin precursor